jgi:hypothetical protein
MPLEVTLSIPAQRIADLMCSAIESGDPVTHGWCDGIYYRTVQTNPPDGNWYVDHPEFYESADFQIEVVELDDETGHKTSHLITRTNLLHGLKVMAEHFPQHFVDFISENDDAATADIFLQCVVFGEEKYA